MDTVRIDTGASLPVRPLNATNGGPFINRHENDQHRTNFADYKAARIPYSRNHDSCACGVYGGPYSHDITAIFPDFEADENDPASYDFACTDESILSCLDAGTQTFFRLGQTIEHQAKKHGTLPPRDFAKWARVCEHIIRHYNEGWADGFRLGMEYWEIWNEPDLDADDSTDKRTWGGTRASFFDLYEITAKHLKSCFPDLKIGGPALAWRLDWGEAFLSEMKKRGVPIDFFSWHIYAADPRDISARAACIRAMLDRHGYVETESILNEWNYIKGWTSEFVYSLEVIHGMKGAAFLSAVMAEAAASSVDMLMYYDTRPSAFDGVFDFYTYRPLKGYWPMLWYGGFYDLAACVPALDRVPDIYVLAGRDAAGKLTVMLTHYTDNDAAAEKTVKLDLGREAVFAVSLLDAAHDGTDAGTVTDGVFTLPPQTCLLLREV